MVYSISTLIIQKGLMQFKINCLLNYCLSISYGYETKKSILKKT